MYDDQILFLEENGFSTEYTQEHENKCLIWKEYPCIPIANTIRNDTKIRVNIILTEINVPITFDRCTPVSRLNIFCSSLDNLKIFVERIIEPLTEHYILISQISYTANQEKLFQIHHFILGEDILLFNMSTPDSSMLINNGELLLLYKERHIKIMEKAIKLYPNLKNLYNHSTENSRLKSKG